MIQVQIIAAFIALMLREALADLQRAGEPLWRPLLGPGETAAAYSAAFLALVVVTHFALAVAGRAIDRTGSIRAARAADRISGAARWGHLFLLGAAVLAGSWLEFVRAHVGEIVAVDELLAMAPLVVGMLASWWSAYPIERRLREAVVLRLLDDGRVVYPIPSRLRHVGDMARHQLGLILVPLAVLMAWNEAFERYVVGSLPSWAPALGVQLAGVLAILLMMPLVIRRVWDTVRLGPGPLRDHLLAMCARHRVRVRDLLVWRTSGTMVNGAVLGFVGPVRYILLTDALLDHLPQRQVEAVTAHEIAHVRKRHLPWLGVGTVSVIIATIGAGDLALAAGPQEWTTGRAGAWLGLGLGLVAFLAGLSAFGAFSRRFERQADAFALRELSRTPPPPAADAPDSQPELIDPPTGRVTPESARAMAGALDAVARLNHIDPRRWTFRHGSIADRQRRLLAAIGLPLDRLPADRAARRSKAAIALACLAAIAVFFLPPPGQDTAQSTPRGPRDALRQDARNR